MAPWTPKPWPQWQKTEWDFGRFRNPTTSVPVSAFLLCGIILLAMRLWRWRKPGTTPSSFAKHHHGDEKASARPDPTQDSTLWIPPPPPPPGAYLLSSQSTNACAMPLMTSGELVAQIDSKRLQTQSIEGNATEHEESSPWRRHSYPREEVYAPQADTVQHFRDDAMTGIWRRRTLEFGFYDGQTINDQAENTKS